MPVHLLLMLHSEVVYEIAYVSFAASYMEYYKSDAFAIPNGHAKKQRFADQLIKGSNLICIVS